MSRNGAVAPRAYIGTRLANRTDAPAIPNSQAIETIAITNLELMTYKPSIASGMQNQADFSHRTTTRAAKTPETESAAKEVHLDNHVHSAIALRTSTFMHQYLRLSGIRSLLTRPRTHMHEDDA